MDERRRVDPGHHDLGDGLLTAGGAEQGRTDQHFGNEAGRPLTGRYRLARGPGVLRRSFALGEVLAE
jgi:hypothetical protein